jgi:hypothetical protein
VLAHIGRAGFGETINKHGVAWMEGTMARMVKSAEEIEAVTLEVSKIGKEEHTTKSTCCFITIHAGCFL